MLQEPYADIFEFYADRAFAMDNRPPPKPELELREYIENSTHGFVLEEAIGHFLSEHAELGFLGTISDEESCQRFMVLFNLGVFILEILPVSSSFPEHHFQIHLLVWDGEEYQNIDQAITEYVGEVP